MSEWISMEKIPENDNVLLTDGKEVFSGSHIYARFLLYEKKLTHWMPLPEPPKPPKPDLKPCPFCGNKNIELREYYHSWDNRVLCEECHVSMQSDTKDDDCKELTEKWNKRS